jgi:hypothetical protein
MPVLQASRRLVKSPPELWAEVSDAASLARHLGDVGEIKITRLEPETTVAWEGERASGTVELAPAGWGTAVTLTAEPIGEAAETADPEPEAASTASPAPEEPTAAIEAEPAPIAEAEPERAAAPASKLAEPTPEPAAEPELAEPTPEPAAEPEPAEATPQPPAAVEPPARRTWLTRLFSRRAPKPADTPELEPAAAAEPQSADADRAGGAGEAISAAPPAESSSPATGPARSSAEPEPEQTDPLEAALTSALDSLGSAHHRPFSRG